MNILEQLTKLSLAKKVGGLAVIVLLVGLVYWQFLYSEITEELERLTNEYASLESQKEDAERRKSTYDNDRHRRDELKKNYAQQLRALPQETEMSSFLNRLNAQAELVGLELLAVKPQKEEAAQYYARIPVELTLKGNYLQLAKFFYLVGNVDRIINIENISFKTDGFDEAGVLLSAKCLATTFRSVNPDTNMATEKSDKKNKKKKGKA